VSAELLPLAAAWLVAPVLVPLATAVAGLLAGDRRAPRLLGVASVVVQLVVAGGLAATSARDVVLVHRFGDWPVPYGVVFVLDRLSALMLVLTAVLALAALLHAVRGEDREGAHFHPLFQLQLAGLNGAFLTGDLFTLFVFFEVLLIASYCLLVHGATAQRLRWGVHYVVLNLVGSTLFLVGAGTMYGLLGTLNLAELARRVALLPPADAGPVGAAALLLLAVFALKAAVAPLHLWLAGTYAAAGASVAALFAIMSKVGVYALLRVFGVAFGAGAGPLAGIAAPWLFPAALLTAALGAVAAFGARVSPAGREHVERAAPDCAPPDHPEPEGTDPDDDPTFGARRQAASLLVMSVGTLVAAVAPLTPGGVAAGLYYLVHSTLAAAALFLVLGRGGATPREGAARGALFVAAALAVAGLPPLSGFVGKAMILAAAPAGSAGAWLWVAVLGSSFLAVVALARTGATLFWEPRAVFAPGAPVPAAALVRAQAGERSPAALAPAGLLLAAVAALTVAAAPAGAFTADAARQLLAPGGYTAAVLATPGGRR
jgi:multicomponent K+:H+ antiporter subunit D